MISRRRFLQGIAWSAAPLAAAALARRESLAWAADRGVAWMGALLLDPKSRLQSHFSYLTLDEAGIEQYLADYTRLRGPVPWHRPLSRDFCTRYLLSTDFFRHGADPSREVRYVGLYDPDNVPCNNPLAQFDDDG